MKQEAAQNCVTEWSFRASKPCKEPFLEREVDVVFTDPDGVSKRVPAFWAGGDGWKVRYASPKVGRHLFRTECSDPEDAGLHGQEGELTVHAYEGDNPLLQHGPIEVRPGSRHFEHADGTPFFWLGDTWWYGLIKDFRWPDEFQELVADRVEKGFNLIQIVAGYLPAMPEHHPRGVNEAGESWDADYRQINPAFFDLADQRIDYLVQNGLVPCIFAMWGYWMMRLGVEGAKRHWRYLVARYGAHPVIWSLCGEVDAVYPDFQKGVPEAERAKTKQELNRGWSDVCRYLAEVDPYARPITAHTYQGIATSEMLEDGSPITFEMTQTGHSLQAGLKKLRESITRIHGFNPPRPVIDGECVYEGIMGSSWEEVQRLAIWASVLSGAAGHTYGAAAGCWHIHHRDRERFVFTSAVWTDETDWRDIAAFKGSGQMQYVPRLLERYEWWRFEPHPEWVETNADPDSPFRPYCAGIPGEVRVIYSPTKFFGHFSLAAILEMEADVTYRAYLYSPRNGTELDLGEVTSQDGRWVPSGFGDAGYLIDHIIVLETAGVRKGGAA